MLIPPLIALVLSVVSPAAHTQAVAAFNGLDAAGSWTLNVSDRFVADTGTLVTWRLGVRTPPVDCNGNGTPDECEVDCQPNGTPDDCEVLIPPTTKLFEQSPNLPIPNNNAAGVSTTIFVPDHGMIDNVSLGLWIDHEAQGDVRATLYHNNVPVRLLNRAGSNAGGCGPSIYGYAADDFGSSAASRLVLADTAGVGIDCYDGAPPGATGIFNYAGPARPSQSLSTYHNIDKYGEWTLVVSDHLFYNSGSLNYWSLTILNQGQGDCNGNGIPDECDIASGYSSDANADGIPDECEIAVVPAVMVRRETRFPVPLESSESRFDQAPKWESSMR